MLAGHLQEKKGYYYVVLTYRDSDGKRHQPWIATKLPVKGNKKRAKEELMRLRMTYEPPEEHTAPENDSRMKNDMLFNDYLITWLDIVRTRVKIATYSSYDKMCKANIIPYFEKQQIRLCDLKAHHIQSYYSFRLRSVKANTVIHEHAVIHQALKYAEKIELIPKNVATQVDRPKKNDFQPSFLDSDEMHDLFSLFKGTKLELPVKVSAFYGLRRGEVLGLKWDAIDFKQQTLTIKHTVTSISVNGKSKIIEQDSAKTKSSLRTLPLVDEFYRYFKEVKEAQELNKKVCGNCYNYDYDGYIFVDELGERIKPNYISSQFKAILRKNNFKEMRFHDLRHSCASLLLSNGVPLKHIQEWLGHSDFSTTANVYAHLDYRSKMSSAEAMLKGLSLPQDDHIDSLWNK